MANLDLKDRKILYQLDLNCRQSNAQIGKKVGLSKQVVDYRIKRMEEEGIITGYWTAIDIFKLGFNVFRIYLKFQDIPISIKKEVIDKFIKYHNSWAVFSVAGPIDLGAVIFVKDIYKFYKFYNDVNENYGNFFAQKIVSIYIQADEYERSYLLYNEYMKTERKKISIKCRDIVVDIDEIDYKILFELAQNANCSIIYLAKKMNISSQSVIYRIDKLLKSEVIKQYRVNLDITKLGLQYFDVRLNMKDISKRNQIINYLKYIPHFKCLNTAIGYSDLELEFHIENMDKLTKIIDELESRFPNAIRNYYFLKTRETHKERWLPEMEFK